MYTSPFHFLFLSLLYLLFWISFSCEWNFRWRDHCHNCSSSSSSSNVAADNRGEKKGLNFKWFVQISKIFIQNKKKFVSIVNCVRVQWRMSETSITTYNNNYFRFILQHFWIAINAYDQCQKNASIHNIEWKMYTRQWEK